MVARVREHGVRCILGASAILSAAILLLSSGVAYAFTPIAVVYPTTAPYLSGIAQGPDGNIWYSSRSGGGRVGKLSPSGTVTEYTPPSTDDTPDIVAGPDGNMWFVEYNTDKIGKITPSGTITEYSVLSTGASLYRITVGPDNNLWFVENGANKIGKITTGGVVTEYDIPTGSSNPQGITTGPDGNLWFTETSGGKIGKITPTGTFTEYTIPGSIAPGDIVVGPDGNLWFGAYQNKIGRITTSGSVTLYDTSAPTFGLVIGPDEQVWFALLTGSNNLGTVSSSGLVTEYPLTGDPYTFQMARGDDNNLYMSAYESSGKVVKVVFPTKPGLSANKATVVAAGSSVVVDLLAGVANSPDPTTLSIVSGPSHGSAVVASGSVTYTPTSGYVGADSLIYKVCSSELQTMCSQAVLGISITIGVPSTGYGRSSSALSQTTARLTLTTAFCLVSIVGYRRYKRHQQAKRLF